MNWPELAEKYRNPVILFLVGLLLLGGGLLVFRLTEPPTQVEVLDGPPEKTLLVDLQGAVFRPGVYQLSDGARLNDLLIRAGGLVAQADRAWVEANLNLAQKLTDGQKIYIPEKQVNSEQLTVNSQKESNQETSHKINLNTATLGELDTLYGIGSARAQAIVDGRPYGAIEEIVIKAKIPQSVFEKIKNEISVY